MFDKETMALPLFRKPCFLHVNMAGCFENHPQQARQLTQSATTNVERAIPLDMYITLYN